jgi:hypothetical protein
MKKCSLLAALLLICSIPALPQAPASGGPSGPNKLALLIGIDNYEYPNAVSPLAGSLNDVEDVKALLIGKYEFPEAGIVVLKNSQATHAAIIAAIQNHLIAKAQPGDIVVVHYSGHGSQMKDVSGTKISGLDETIVPYDSRDPQGKVFDISGMELHALLRQLSAKTRNITFILDSCHSGTLVRGGRIRWTAADKRTPPPLPAYASKERGLHEVASEPTPPFALIAAATSKENAFEHIGGGKEHGALTWFLTQQLRLSKPGSTYRDVMDSVIANVNANYPAQHPQLEGTDADQQVFSGAVALSQAYVTASPLDKSRVQLGAGTVSDVTIGSTYDVYRPGTKRFDSTEKPLATVQVTSVADFTAQAKILSGGVILTGSRSVERNHRYGTAKLRLYLHEADSSRTLQDLKAALSLMPQVEIVANPALCHLQLEESSDRILILGPDQTTFSNPVPVNSADAINHLVKEISNWAKWFDVLSIRPAFPGPETQVTIAAGGSGNVSRDPFQKIGGAEASVRGGEIVTVKVKNDSTRALYISILDLSTDGSISTIYPVVNGASEVLNPGLTLSRDFRAFVAAGRSSVKDTLKVFASTKPIDLRPLNQSGIRGIGDTPTCDLSDSLNQALCDAVGRPRGLAPVESGAGGSVSADSPKVAEWTASQKMLSIRK